MTIRLQRYIAILSVVLFLAKLLAWYLTNSVTILTDALESTVNVIAGFIGLYSVTLAAKPRDMDHPYGHGKIEFVSAAVEGSLIFIAGLMIIYQAIGQMIHPKPLQKLDIGIYLTAATGVVNFLVGTYAVSVGKQNRSLTVEAAGNHLRTDAYSTLGIVIGLALLLFTGWQWLDSAVAVGFAIMILVTGYRLMRRSMAGIMDEADSALLQQVVKVMQENRKAQWIDLHNLRVILYGDVMHIDAHMTLPWYHQVTDAEREIHAVEELIQTTFGNRVEVFIHIDACMPYQCKLCAVPECPHRHHGLEKPLVWTVDNVLVDSKHGKDTA
ncbi:cation diffusion facilitator family transporter [Polluticoccus soli]|uniref:cation diffusion facilitator family transporter n=1 Tax=Polluticoccus soli TaxID=3034150 RepID=UPI0023E2EA5C|nr:cation diffusion facilitator family transporter [Flavipsychrobacter sp. JY13-12]